MNLTGYPKVLNEVEVTKQKIAHRIKTQNQSRQATLWFVHIVQLLPTIVLPPRLLLSNGLATFPESGATPFHFPIFAIVLPSLESSFLLSLPVFGLSSTLGSGMGTSSVGAGVLGLGLGLELASVTFLVFFLFAAADPRGTPSPGTPQRVTCFLKCLLSSHGCCYYIDCLSLNVIFQFPPEQWMHTHTHTRLYPYPPPRPVLTSSSLSGLGKAIGSVKDTDTNGTVKQHNTESVPCKQLSRSSMMASTSPT